MSKGYEQSIQLPPYGRCTLMLKPNPIKNLCVGGGGSRLSKVVKLDMHVNVMYTIHPKLPVENEHFVHVKYGNVLPNPGNSR